MLGYTTSSPLVRRQFLRRAILAAAGAIGALPSRTIAREPIDLAKQDCTGLKVPMTEVVGKVAFITGGSSGIGLGIARAFIEAGMRVVVTYRTKRHMEEAMNYFRHARSRIHAISVDVTDRKGMEEAAAETLRVFGKVHVLCNNAGVLGFGGIDSTSHDDWHWTMNVNVNGVFNGVHAFLPLIQANGEGGQIITTASIAGLLAHPGSTSYVASKFAVVGMMESLRAELADSKVGVSLFCPGMVQSNIIDSSRNRPSAAVESRFNKDKQLLSSLSNSLKNAMDPLKAGEAVLEGIRKNNLYIFTHSEYEIAMRNRSDALAASFPKTARPSDALMETITRDYSIYRRAIDQRLCTDRVSDLK